MHTPHSKDGNRRDQIEQQRALRSNKDKQNNEIPYARRRRYDNCNKGMK